jgi:predicted flap endonuclease-1-like 5' DNA nuclease
MEEVRMNTISFLQQADESSPGWVWYLLVVLVALALLIWWMYQQSRKQSEEDAKVQVKQESSMAVEAPKREGAGDDLTIIEGIGPKVARVLKEAGITSFDSLSQADAAEVKNVLTAAGLQMMSPEGWIEQADLAAKEDWEGLEKLQDELKGGRRK